MERVEPSQLIGLVFAVALTIAAVLLLNWRTEVWKGMRVSAALIRDVFGYFFYVMWHPDDSGSEGEGEGIEPPVPDAVLPLPAAADTDTRIPISENMSRAELLDILARQRADGRYVFSANKLVELLSNTPHAVSRNVLLEEVAAIRKADSPTPPKRPAQRLERPANGW